MPNLLSMDSQVAKSPLRGPKDEQKLLRKREIIKNQIEAGQISSFQHLFDIYAKTTLAPDLYLTFFALGKKVSDPGQFSLHDIYHFADFFNLGFKIAFNFFYIQFKTYVNDRKTIRLSSAERFFEK